MELEKLLTTIPYRREDIICVLQVGSSLYLKDFGDYDFVVLIKEHRPEAVENISRTFEGRELDLIHFTPREWKNVMKHKRAYYLTQCVDAKCIYGDDKDFIRYDVVKDKEVRKYVLDMYDICLFGDNPSMNDKRLWNFLNFYYKCKNNEHKLKKWQLNEMQKAHDLKISKEDCLALLKELKGEIQ